MNPVHRGGYVHVSDKVNPIHRDGYVHVSDKVNPSPIGVVMSTLVTSESTSPKMPLVCTRLNHVCGIKQTASGTDRPLRDVKSRRGQSWYDSPHRGGVV